jgi:hypothetical protein
MVLDEAAVAVGAADDLPAADAGEDDRVAIPPGTGRPPPRRVTLVNVRYRAGESPTE